MQSLVHADVAAAVLTQQEVLEQKKNPSGTGQPCCRSSRGAGEVSTASKTPGIAAKLLLGVFPALL